MEQQSGNNDVLQLIREQVKRRLTGSQAFNDLDPGRRKAVAHDTVKALHYILAGEDGQSVPGSVTLSGNTAAFAPATATPVRPVAPAGGRAPQPAGQGRPAGNQRPGFGDAAREGGEAFADLVADINFPQFVGGLIDGVFNSIVTSSIQQMEAYAEMVKNVSKSVDQYMKDNVTENNARDYLAERYPDFLEVDIAGEKPRVKPKEGHDDAALPDFFNDLGLKAPVSGLDEDQVEQEFVPAARRRIAMDRQQLLATMVMMGVNRLVVTNGSIEASCLFELDTRDVRTRTDVATREYERNREQGGERGYTGEYNWSDEQDKWKGSGKSNWYNKSNYKDTARFRMHTVSTRTDENTIDMHAKLTGKVKVNFKSDYFPLEKMVDVLQVNQIREKTQAGIAPPAQPAAPPPALPPMPQIPAMPVPPVPSPAPIPAAPAR